MRFWWKSPRRVNRQVGPCSRRYLLPAQARPHWVPVGREQKQRVARQLGVAPLEHKPIWISREIDECPSQSSETERAQLYPGTLRRQSPPNTRHPTRAARDQQGPRRAISQYLIARQQFGELQRDQAPAPALASRTPCTSQHTAIWPVFYTQDMRDLVQPIWARQFRWMAFSRPAVVHKHTVRVERPSRPLQKTQEWGRETEDPAPLSTKLLHRRGGRPNARTKRERRDITNKPNGKDPRTRGRATGPNYTHERQKKRAHAQVGREMEKKTP